MMGEENILYKKAYFQCAKRAILENEVFMKKFMADIVKDNYNDDKLNRLNALLTEMFDNDMFDLIMGVKKADDLKSKYDYEICLDIERYADTVKPGGEPL